MRILFCSIFWSIRTPNAVTELCYTYPQPLKEIQKSIQCFHLKRQSQNTPDLIGEDPKLRASAHIKVKDSCFVPHFQLHSHKLIAIFLPVESFGT